MGYAFLQWFVNVKHCTLLFHSKSSVAISPVAADDDVVVVIVLPLVSPYPPPQTVQASVVFLNHYLPLPKALAALYSKSSFGLRHGSTSHLGTTTPIIIIIPIKLETAYDILQPNKLSFDIAQIDQYLDLTDSGGSLCITSSVRDSSSLRRTNNILLIRLCVLR